MCALYCTVLLSLVTPSKKEKLICIQQEQNTAHLFMALAPWNYKIGVCNANKNASCYETEECHCNQETFISNMVPIKRGPRASKCQPRLYNIYAFLFTFLGFTRCFLMCISYIFFRFDSSLNYYYKSAIYLPHFITFIVFLPNISSSPHTI
jgi:hypothetical protein